MPNKIKIEAMADVLVLSDLHAMSPEVDVTRFTRFIRQHPARRVVLAGDTLDFYIWRHARTRSNVAAGITVLEELVRLAESGVEVIILPGNHDLEWAWLDGMATKRQKTAAYPEGMRELMVHLLELAHVWVLNQFVVEDTVIVHGHEGWQGDWLWRASEMGDKLTRYKTVGAGLRRTVMGNAPDKLRAAAVRGHGFYRRLAGWGRKLGMKHIIHGHTHCEGRRVRKEMVLDCLPAWRPGEGEGGGMVLHGKVWSRVGVE